ncbi:MAG: serine/threonine protein kinase [Kineothrix sp.]
MGDKYAVCGQLGQGGSGRVYRAYDQHLQCHVAIKEFRAGDGISAKELGILKELRHPALPVILDYLEEDGNRYLVMEYIEGMNLEEYICEKGRIPQEKAVGWAQELAGVLAYLHERERPVVYRDMKPSNIMIDTKGSIWLVDFGTAYLHYHEGEEPFVRAGTHGYGAPELFLGKGGVDERSDIYGLGATLFHMLTGINPAQPPCLMQPIRTYDRCFLPELERIVQKATEQDKEKRYQTVRQMMEELKGCGREKLWRKGMVRIAELAYCCLLLGLILHFLGVCRAAGVLHMEWAQGEIWKSRVSLREIELGRQAVWEILQAAFLIFSVCTGGEAVRRWRERGRQEVKHGRSLLLTSKKGKGLMLAALAGVLAVSGSAWAGADGELAVHVKNGNGQKVLIRHDAIYALDGMLKLELPADNFEEGRCYELELECVDRDTGERRNRTFYLKRLEP